MSTNPELAKKREMAARAAIKKAYGTPDDEFGATLFVSHHLEEIDSEYWAAHTGSGSPKPAQVLEILTLQTCWGGEHDLDTLDFTLPDEETHYVISVSFGADGEVESIAMES